MEELEDLRKRIKSRYIKSFFITFICFYLIAILFTILIHVRVGGDRITFTGFERGEQFFVTFFIITFFDLIMCSIVGAIATGKLNREFKQKYKEYFVLKALNNYFTDLIYDPNRGMPQKVIADTHMMFMGDRYRSNDYISAKYKGIAFEQADVHIEEEHETTDSKGHTTRYYVTIFRGRWMIFDFNKTFKANVQISQKGFGNSYVNKYWGKEEQKFKKVEMESEEFNKRFNVFAQSEHDAFYIITPAFMQRIQKLDDVNSGKLLFCFIDNKLHIGLYDGKDAFEPKSPFKEIDEESTVAEISEDINKVIQFVDELNLDNTLFTKEV